ncbi:hypothetical protein BPORC_1770 [Bifidobacterium porcinum]|nr:hypothetical protein BPORC_1770 [Bifidobacterium porcinum]
MIPRIAAGLQGGRPVASASERPPSWYYRRKRPTKETSERRLPAPRIGCARHRHD